MSAPININASRQLLECTAMKSTGKRSTIKDLKDPFFRQVYGERRMSLRR